MHPLIYILFPLFLSLLLCHSFLFLTTHLQPATVWLATTLPFTQDYSAHGLIFVLIALLYLKLIWIILRHK